MKLRTNQRAVVLARLLAIGACGVALSGCGAFTWVKTRFTGEPAAVPAPAAAVPAAPAPAPGAEIADAVPKVEPLHPTANKWYGAHGRMYRPITDEREFKDTGRAAVLGASYDGKPTASGEPFAALSMSAAHPTLPIPSYARVTNLRTGKSAIVRIVDRGAFNRGEAIAISAAAAQKLALAGSDDVEVERITPEMIARMTPPPAPPASVPAAAAEPARPVVEVPPPPPPPAPAAVTPLPAAPPPASPAPAAAPPPATSGPVAAVAPPAAATGRVPTPATAGGGRWWVQIAAFAVDSVAQSVRTRVAEQLAQGAADLPAPRVERRGNRSFVLVGDFDDRAAAEAAAERVRRALRQDVVVERR